MKKLILIDTSVWIDLLRGTASPERMNEVAALMQDARAAWCGMVRVELWSGVRDERERKKLRALDAAVVHLSTAETTWETAAKLADRGRAIGISTPTTDLLIFACARAHGAEMLHADHHFDRLEKIRLN